MAICVHEMTTNEKPDLKSHESASCDSDASCQQDDNLIPRDLLCSDESFARINLSSSLNVAFSDEKEKHLDICDSFNDGRTNKNISTKDLNPHFIGQESDDPINVCLSRTTHLKSKRSSSASNDLSHERDRFIARFESFNPPNWAILEDDVSECPQCEESSTKTKKLNIKHETECCLTESAMNLTLEYPTENIISPLDRRSSHFKQFRQCLGPVATQSLDLRQITPKQLSIAFSWYFNNPLPPTDHMFPWLHGLHPENFAQRSFFGSQIKDTGLPQGHTLDCENPKIARFMMCVNTTGKVLKAKVKTLRNTVSPDEILQRVEVARSEARCLVNNLVNTLFPQIENPNLDVSGLSEAIILDCLETGFMPCFVDSDPKRGVSLRNFHIQVNKVAKCADFVIYCETHAKSEKHCKCMSFARLIKVAQIAENPQTPFKYDVFVLDPKENDTQYLHPKLWSVRDNSGVLIGTDVRKKTQLHFSGLGHVKLDIFGSWDADYQVKEKLETTLMSAATKLHLNVWLGNIWDHQVMLLYLRGETTLYSEDSIKIIPICEGKDKYCDPQSSLLIKVSESSADTKITSFLPPPRCHWQLFIHCHNDALFPSLSILNDLLFKYTISSRKASEVSDVHQLEFPSSGSIGFGDCRQETLVSIVNTCKLLYLYSSSESPDSIASLIYCSDGYTELSLLIFCFLMYAEDVPLENAMLKLHLDYGRPFYAFNTDVQVLRKLEVLLRKYSPKRLGSTISWSRGEVITQKEINEIFLKPKQLSKKESGSIPRKLRLGYIASESSSESDDSDFECENDQNEGVLALERNWVEDLEGSLPSKILPYMYLGSLKHASNPIVLSKLGITKVISAGENLEWLHDSNFKNTHDIDMECTNGNKIEHFRIKPKNLNSTHEPQCNVTSVIKLNNLLDDGIDDLSDTLPQVLEFIDREYKHSKGMTKFLVHCRVGVSRSATIVIAEVMRRLKLNLPQAYLYVRVRRLNIVIQPNLRFMYELFKWEEKERLKAIEGCQTAKKALSCDLRVTDWFVMCREIQKLNMPFIRY